MKRAGILFLAVVLGPYLLVLVSCSLAQRKLLYYPTHHTGQSDLIQPWTVKGETIGVAREVANPTNVWLMLHGNAGQASLRTYALPCFSDDDAVFILEYPGYGQRKGSPSLKAFHAAAEEAYRALRSRFPGRPVGVVGESIGSGPASHLSSLQPPPDKIVLITPFEELAKVAQEHAPWLPARLILRDNWNNGTSLRGYRGPIEIYGAEQDPVIPIHHARALAQGLPQARFHAIGGGHNDWSEGGKVSIRHP